MPITVQQLDDLVGLLKLERAGNPVLEPGNALEVDLVGAQGLHIPDLITIEFLQNVLEIPFDQPVRAHVRWSIADSGGREVRPLTTQGGTHFLAWVEPLFVPWAQMNEQVAYNVTANVRLSLLDESVSSNEIAVGPVSIPVKKVPIPTLLAMTNSVNLSHQSPGMDNAYGVVILPAGIALDEVTRSVNQTMDNLRGLQGLSVLVDAVLGGFSQFLRFTSTFADPTRKRPVNAGESDKAFNDFFDIEFRPYPARYSAEDTMISMLVVAPKGHGVRVFNRPDCQKGAGELEVKAGDACHVFIPNLGMPPKQSRRAGGPAVSSPQNMPPLTASQVTVRHDPDERWKNNFLSLSSMQFV